MPTDPSQQTIAFYLNHPAHYHLFKNVINRLIKRSFCVKVVIVSKDVLADLVAREPWDVVNIFPEGRRSKKLPSILSLPFYFLKTEWRLWKVMRRLKPDIIIGTEGTIAHTGFILGIPTALFNEDDTHATPENYLFYPFATRIFVPACCDVGHWHKKITYQGYHELAYLHPHYFRADEYVLDELGLKDKNYFILRLAELSASHDLGKKGISNELALKIISTLNNYGEVFISSERDLPDDLKRYRLKIAPHQMLDVLYSAQMYIGDSQTMAAEAAVMGTPSLRFNDFAGKLGYLEELEDIYELTYGFNTHQEKRFLDKIRSLLQMPHLKQHWKNKAKIMLVEKIDVTMFMMVMIEEMLKGKGR